MPLDGTAHKTLREDIVKLGGIPLSLTSGSLTVAKIHSMISLAKDLQSDELLEQIAASLGRHAATPHTISLKFPNLVELFRGAKTTLDLLARHLSTHLPDLYEYLCYSELKQQESIRKKLQARHFPNQYEYLCYSNLKQQESIRKKLQARLAGQEMELAIATRDNYQKSYSELYHPAGHESLWINQNNLDDLDDLDKDSMIHISHGGGKYAIMAFLKGEWAGYKLEKSGKLGLHVHPCSNEAHISRECYYSQNAAGYLDQPARLIAEVPARFVLSTNNLYEGAITPESIPFIENITLRCNNEVIYLPKDVSSTTKFPKESLGPHGKAALCNEAMHRSASSLSFYSGTKLDETGDPLASLDNSTIHPN